MDTSLLIKTLNTLEIPYLRNDPVIEVQPLGSGESNINRLLITTSGNKYVMRSSKQNNIAAIQNEFDVLNLVPGGLAPQPLYLHTQAEPFAFMIISYIEGERIDAHNTNHLKALARSMAKYHSITSVHFGGHHSKKKQLNLQAFSNEINNTYFQDAPHLKEDKDIRALKPQMFEYLALVQPVFDAMQEFSLLHGDMTQNNITYANGKITFYDWELSIFGDPAHDFATFYYSDTPFYTWRVQLTAEEENVLITEYLKHRKDSSLQQRIRVWQLFDKYCGIVYCKWKLQEYKKELKLGRHTLSREELEHEIGQLITTLHQNLKSVSP